MNPGIDKYFGQLLSLFSWEKAAPGSCRPQKETDARDKRNKGKLTCGPGRFKHDKRNAFFFKETGAGLNFEINWEVQRGSLVFPSYSIAFIHPDGPAILYHKDPEPSRMKWPEHPLRHIQIDGAAPATFWKDVRLPCFFTDDQTGDDPLRIVEFFTLLAASSCEGRSD